MRTKINTLILFLAVGLTAFSQAKQTQLTGKVKDSSTGELLAGVTVQIEGTKDVVKTDANGGFSLKTSKKLPFTVVLNYVGYQRQENIIESADDEFNFEIRQNSNLLNKVVVTSRRRNETVQEVPIPISVVTGAQAEQTGSFNVNRIKELIPSVQLYSSNPRNTALSIRGLGTTFGLTNDGIDPGVGFYVDGVYYARPAATTLDFVDIDRIEVLRGPQGTLFGKNTTAGAFNVTTKKPSFTPGADFEVSYGNYNYIQAKSSITGKLLDKVAGRISFSGTQRNGTIYNQRTESYVNELNNLGTRGQLLCQPSKNFSLFLAADWSHQAPAGYAQVFAGSVKTKRKAYRQYDQIAADLGYTIPSTNPFDRVIDQDTPAKANQDFGGASLNADIKLGSGTLTSTTAWRYWNWDPSTDRDFTGLQALNKSQAPSVHNQASQEIRWAGSIGSKISAVFGAFAFYQNLKANSTEEAGKDQWRFSYDSTVVANRALWQTAGLLNGYGIKTNSELNTFSGAVFGQVDVVVVKNLHVLPGIRANYDWKKVDFNRAVYGSIQTTDASLLKIRKALGYTNQSFDVDKDNVNYSGQLTVTYKAAKNINTFATFSTGYRPVGVNLGGLPSDASGNPRTDLAVIKPERIFHSEIGVKTTPTKNSILNLTIYNSDIKDYQAQVQSPELGVNRGYLANAEKVNVKGAELEGSINLNKNWTLNASGAYTDAKFVKFTNAPLPLEETGLKDASGNAIYFKDISGSCLPGVSKWVTSFGAQYAHEGSFLQKSGEYFAGIDGYYRSEFSSNPSPSKYLNVAGYSLFNARVGFRTAKGTSVTLWGRNIFNTDYFEQLLVGAGNSGQYAGVLGDPRTYGVTLKYSF
jgi:iron complex outermembrane receptor protein